MKVTPQKLKRTAAALALVVLAAAACPAQGAPAAAQAAPAARQLAAFEKLEAFDFSKQSVTREQLEELDLSHMMLLGGLLLGRHGHVFEDREIQAYLKRKPWYRPDPSFDGSTLNETERATLKLVDEVSFKATIERVEALVRASGQNLNAFEKAERFDFSKQKATREQLEDLDQWDLKKVRGIVFGRHGRVFTDRDIQGYLKEQTWYKPDPNFSNATLNATERANLDLIRELEAEKHEQIEPGDLRWWQAKPMTAEKLGAHSAGEWLILRAEVEAVRGKRFDNDPWLQNYFEERYWYKADPSYDARRLTPTERKNLAVIDAAQRKQRKAAVSPGDMEHFERRLVTEEMLKGLSLHELRLLRNEVYARRGRQFRTEWLAQYFWSQPWYEGREDNAEPELSETEKKNVETIVAYERKVKDSLSAQPIPRGLLEGMFLEDARKLRQEIYARHGKVFKDKWLQRYFQSFDWYKADPKYTDALLTSVEKQNINAIAAYEKKATSVLDAVEG